MIVLIVATLVIGAGAAVLLSKSGGDDGPVDDGAAEGYPRTVYDSDGTAILLNKAPERVIVAEIEYLAYLGADVLDRVILAREGTGTMLSDETIIRWYGLEDVCTIAGKTGEMMGMVERFIGKQPDLVLLSNIHSTPEDRAEFRSTLETVGAQVYFYDESVSTTTECLEAKLMPIAEIFAKEDRVRQLIDYVDGSVARLRAMMEESGPREVVDVYVAGVKGRNQHGVEFLTSTSEYQPLESLEGYVNNIIDIGGTSTAMGFENLYQYEAESGEMDFLFLNAACWSDFLNKWRSDTSRFTALGPFKTGEVYLIANHYPLTYMTLASAYNIASCIAPEAFEGFDTDGQIREIIDTFYGSSELGGLVYDDVSGYFREVTGMDADFVSKVDLTAL